MKLKDELKELDLKFYVKCFVLIDKRIMKRNIGDEVKKDDIDWSKDL